LKILKTITVSLTRENVAQQTNKFNMFRITLQGIFTRMNV
jgi:hypothetical protein